MTTHFPSIDELKTSYPTYFPRLPEKPEKGHINGHDHQFYIKAGKADIRHDDTAWKVSRVVMAVGLTLCSLALIPLANRSFRKLLSQLWKEVIYGHERISLYVLKSGFIPTSSSQTSKVKKNENDSGKTNNEFKKDPTSIEAFDSIINSVESGAWDYQPEKLKFLTDEHLASLKMLKKGTLSKILPYSIYGHSADLTKKAELKQRLSQINKELICKLVEKGELDDERYILEALSDEQLSSLKVINMGTLTKIFPNPYSNKTESALLMQKMSALNKELICKIIEDGKLTYKEAYLTKLFSKEQISSLKQIKKNTLSQIFCHFNSKYEQKQKIAQLNEEDTCKMIKLVEDGKIDEGYILEALSDAHLASLRVLKKGTLSKILPYSIYCDQKAELKQRVGQLNKELICNFVENVDHNYEDYILEVLSDEHLASLKVLKTSTLEEIFPNPWNDQSKKAELKQRLSQLNKELICNLVEKGELDSSYILKALSEEHLASLNVLKKSTFLAILPKWDDQSELKQRLSQLNKEFICNLVEKGELDAESHILKALSSEQVGALKAFSASTLKKLLPNPWFNESEQKVLKQKISVLNKELLCNLVEAGELDEEGHILERLSLEQLGALKVLKKSTLIKIIPYAWNAKPKIDILFNQHICKKVEDGELDDAKEILEALTIEQLNALTLSKKSTLIGILPPKPFGVSPVSYQAWLKPRISAINKEFICKMVEDGELDDAEHILQLLSIEQLGNLKAFTKNTLTKMLPKPYKNGKAELKQRLSHLNKEFICNFVEDGELDDYHYILKSLSIEQLGCLKKVSAATLRKIFSNPRGISQKEADLSIRMAELKWPILNELFEGAPDLPSYLIHLLPQNYLNQIDFSLPQQTKINQFFPLCDFDSMKIKHSCLFAIDGKKVRIPIIPDTLIQQLADERKVKNEELFAKLTLGQQETVKPRMYLKDPFFTLEEIPFDSTYFDKCYKLFLDYGGLLTPSDDLSKLKKAYKKIHFWESFQKSKVYKDECKTDDEYKEKKQAAQIEYELLLAIKQAATQIYLS